jgi:hypothetical protein
MWVWVHEDAPPDPGALGAFAGAQRVGDAFVSVPWGGPTPLTHDLVAALRARGVRVSALGGDPSWVDGDGAVTWARRATSAWLFDGVHLDIEPWELPEWAGDRERLLAGLERAVRDVAAATSLPVEVDLAPWLADEHPQAFAGIARQTDRITLMAYRDRAAGILSFSAAARRQLAKSRTPYRIGVETIAGPPPHVTFADDGGAVLERELALVAAQLAGDRWFAGVAVHDAAGWQSLGS